MNYPETLKYLFSQLPMYQRIGAAAYKDNLDNTLTLDKITGYPHKSFKTLHIAGTNGKGSVANIIASILTEAGLKTGLFTSPHLKDFRERIRVNGKMVTEDFVCKFVEKNKPDFEKINPSFFEMTFAMAMSYFQNQKVDIAVVETGMGGRLDSTNIITPLLSVITNISFDHMQFLGDTIEKIAKEKAGIIKQGIPLIIGCENREYFDVIKKIADEKNSIVKIAEKEIELIVHEHSTDGITFSYKLAEEEYGNSLFFSSAGAYQIQNLKTALLSVLLLRKHFSISGQHIACGIKNVIQNTGFMGRWQIMGYNPLFICDTAHNYEGITQVVRQLKKIKTEKLHIVLGMVNDKDVDTILRLFPKDAIYYFCTPEIPRGLDSAILMQKAQQAGLTGDNYGSVALAVKSAGENAGSNDLIFAGGSTFVVAEVV